ncbi:MAG: tRNA pseudouridine(55) synthase TruB [Spirochaetaceae bacterium]|nr:tRNA pseudouridine(55) synthase TruB [Spirochaetaceae bacterium]
MTETTRNEGFLLLNKKPGITSFEALKEVKKAFSTGQVGHTGTLDKFAEGLLIALVGRAVKLTPWFSGGDKRYEGTIRFGVETDTLDPEGAPLAEGEMPSLDALVCALASFRGNILQRPPAYSAIHIGGKRASKLARNGAIPEMPKRPVSVYALELRSYRPPFAEVYIHCSKGTYIRSLARDIALAAGSRAHLASLKRTHIAGFSVEDAVNPAVGALKPLNQQAFETLGISCVTVSEEEAGKIIHGQALENIPELQGETAAGIFRDNGELLAVLKKEQHRWRYGYVYARE